MSEPPVSTVNPSRDPRWIRSESLHGDASTRRYTRLWDDRGQTVIWVRYPPVEARRMRLDLEVTDWLRQRGLPVPDVLAVGSDWALLEDLGREDAEQRLRRTDVADRTRLARGLVEPIVTLSTVAPDDLPRWHPPLDRALLRWELAGFELWYVRHRLAVGPSAELGRWLDDLADTVGAHPRRVCHRDYHLNNVFFDARDRPRVIDAQDARIGPDTYDLVSLLEERAAPRLLGPGARQAIAEHWASRTAAANGWRERYRLVRWQRAFKVLGTFARLVASGGTGYAAWMEALRHELLAGQGDDRLPAFVAALLIDSVEDGGRNAR